MMQRRTIDRRLILGAFAAGTVIAAFSLRPVISPHLVEDSPGLSWLSGVAPKRAPLVLGAAGAAFAVVIWFAGQPAVLAGALATAMLGTSAGMVHSQRRLVAEDMGAHPRLAALPAGMLVVTREPVLLDAPVSAREGAVWVYEMNGQAVHRLGATETPARRPEPPERGPQAP